MAEFFINFTNYIDEDAPVKIRMIGETQQEDNVNVERVNSDIMALEYIVSGEGILEINGKTYYPKVGDVFFLQKGISHKYSSNKKNGWHKIWVAFDGRLMEEIVDMYLPKDTYLFSNCYVGNYFRDILYYLKNFKNNYKKLTDGVSIKLFEIFTAIRGSASSAKKVSLAMQIKDTLDMMVESELSLESLSAQFGYTKNHIIHIFKQAFGITPYNYFLERKIEYAKVYLDNCSLSIADIAQKLSFSDQQYFSICFKKIVGIPPIAYRNKKFPAGFDKSQSTLV